jgi:hypothetical protein
MESHFAPRERSSRKHTAFPQDPFDPGSHTRKQACMQANTHKPFRPGSIFPHCQSACSYDCPPEVSQSFPPKSQRQAEQCLCLCVPGVWTAPWLPTQQDHCFKLPIKHCWVLFSLREKNLLNANPHCPWPPSLLAQPFHPVLFFILLFLAWTLSDPHSNAEL